MSPLRGVHIANKQAKMEPDRAAKATQQTHSVFECGINTLYDETSVYTEIYYHQGNLYYRRLEREARGRLYMRRQALPPDSTGYGLGTRLACMYLAVLAKYVRTPHVSICMYLLCLAIISCGFHVNRWLHRDHGDLFGDTDHSCSYLQTSLTQSRNLEPWIFFSIEKYV